MLNNPGVLAFSAPTYTLTENGTTITQVTVTRTGGSDTEVSGTITLNNGTATADDYNNTPIKVTFAHGDSAPKIITIPIKEDSQFEAVETLNLSLTNPTNGVTIGTQNTAIVKIIDNDNFVFNNTDIQPTKLEKLTLPIPTALKQYETLSSELDKAKVKLDTTEQQLRLANDDYSFAKETFEGSLSKRKSLTDILQNLANKKTALTSSFTKAKTEIEQKQKDIQKNIDDAYTRLKAETNAGLKDGIQKEINGYLIQIEQQQNLLSIATTKYNQELAVVIFQIDDSNQELQGLESNIIPKQVEDLEKKNQALVGVKTAWEGNKQAVTVADKALGDLLTDYAFLKTQDYSSKFLQDTVDSLKQKIGALQADLTALKSGNGSNSEIAALEKAILEKQKVVGEVQDYQKTVLAGELEFKQELETRKATSADHEASVKVALGNNNIEGYVSLNSQLANQLKGLTTVWVDNLEDNHNLTIKVWNGSQATSQGFDSLTSYIDENLATPYGDYYLNEIQLDEALQIRESTVRRRDALADSVDFVEDALFLAKKQLQEYQDLAKLGQHYSDLTKYEKQYALLTSLRDSFTRFFGNYSALSGTYNNLANVDTQINHTKQYAQSRVAAYNPKTRPETGNLYFKTGYGRSYNIQNWATTIGGNLVTVNDIQEQFWITDNFGTNFWIGLTDDHNHNGPWRWFSGEPYQYQSWQWIPGEPNNAGGETFVVSLGRANGWNDIDWEDNRQGLVEINLEISLKPLYNQRNGIIQNIKDANVNAFDALKSLSDLLSNNQLASLLQGVNIGFVKSYLEKYNEIFTQSGGIIDEATLKRFQNEVFTPLSQAYNQLATGSSVEGLIGNNRPLLISNLNQELTNKSQDLVVQIDLNPSNVKYITSSIAVEYQGQKYYGWITYDNSVLKRQGQEWLSGDKIQDFGFNFLGKTYYRQDFYWDTTGISLGFVDGNPVAALFAFNTPDGRNFGFGQESTSNINWTHGFLQWDYPNARWIENVGTIDFSDPANVQHLEWQEQWIETNLQKYIKQKRDSIIPNGVNDQTIANLQSLRLETAYLTLQAQQNPDKVQNYLQTYNALKVLGTTENQGTDLSLFDIVTPQNGVYQDWLRFDYGANIIPGDFNGDGKTDFIRQEKGGWDDETSNSFNIYFSKGDGQFDIVTPNIYDYQNYLRFDPGVNIIPGDYNGDGKTDFIRQEKGGWDDDTIASFQIYISRGDGYFDIITPNNADYQNYLRFDPGVNIIPGDYNGDRKTDFIRQEKGGWDDDTIASFQIYISRGDGYFDIITPEGGVYQDWLRFDYGANIIPGDFNGDGKTDFIRQEKGGWDDETSNSFNIYFSKGDGKFDIITPNIQDYQTFLRFDPGANLIPGDYNGDGKTDFIRQEKGGWDDDTIASFQIYVSRGDGYFDIITPENGVYQDWWRFDYGANIISGDYNGDGYDDFIRQEKGGWDDDLTNNFNVYFSNPAKQQALKLLGSNDGVKNITFNSLRNQYYPELNNPTTLATLQQQISDQQTQSQQEIDQLKNSISQKQAEAAASISQADWYQEKSAFYWEQSRKQGPTWIEWRSYKKGGLFGSKTKWTAITHVDHDWIIWDTYTKQATALREHAAQLLKGVETDTLNKDTTTTILDQWNKANAVANEAALSQSEFIHLLQQLEAERKLSEDKIAQISDWEKLLPILQTQLEIATQDATTATTNVQKETGEYQTSKDNYLTALNSVLEKRAELQTKTQLLQQDITAAKTWVTQQTIYLADELTQTQTLITQLQTQRDLIPPTSLDNGGEENLTKKAQLDQSIQLLTQKQTVLTSQQATLTQKQTLLSTQEQVLVTEYQLLDATLASPDKDTSTLEQQLTDTRKTLAEVQKLAEQAEASSQALTAVMDDLQASLLLQNDKYLAAIKDKQQALKKLLEATELEKNYTLQATTKRQELNSFESQLLTILKQANDAGSQEAAQLLEVANANNMATAAELYYKDYRDLASDKGGGCSGGIARPEDLILADKYYAEMQQYRQLQQQAQQQASQFTALRQAAENQITLLEGQKALATEELAQLQQSIGNSQEAIEAHKQEIAVAEFRIDALSQLKNWTNQTLLQVLSVEKFNLAQAQLEQEIAEKRGQLIDDAVAAQLEKQRLDIQRDRQIAVTKLEQLNQLNTEEALQQAINNLRTDLGINPIANIITQADYKGQLAGILADLDALKQKQPSLPAELESILTATRQDIHDALQGKEAATIQDNLLKTVDGLIDKNNKLNAEVTKLEQEEQQYLGILKQSETDLKGASKALYDEIQKTGVLTQEKELLSQQNLEILYKIGYAQGAVDLSDDLARQSQQLLSQIIEGRVKEREIRKKAFVNEVLGTAALVIAIASAAITAGATLYAYATTAATLGASLAAASSLTIVTTLNVIGASISAVQSAYNGDWAGAVFHAAMAFASYEISDINSELAKNPQVIETTKAIDVAKEAKDLSLVGELTQKLELLKYELSPNLLNLTRFQTVAQGAYSSYQYAKTGDTTLALLSGVQSLANAASLGIKDITNLNQASDIQKFFITAGQVSLVTAQGIKAIENGNWLDAANAIGKIAGQIDKNFALGLGEAGKKELIDLTGLKWEEIQDFGKLSSALYQTIDNKDWIKAIQTAGKAINLVDDSLLGVDLGTEAHKAIKDLTGFEWEEVETIIQSGVKLEIAVRERNLEAITQSVKSIVNVWVTDDKLKLEAQKVTGLSWEEIQRITQTGEAINKAIEKGDTAAWIKSSNELLDIWQGNQTLQNFLKTNLNLDWKDFQQVVKAGQSIAIATDKQSVEQWGQSLKEVLNIWYDDDTLKNKLTTVSGLSWEQIQKTEETISTLNKAYEQGNTLAWIEASNKILKLWETDQTLANKIKVNTGLDWQDFEKIVKAGQATAIAVDSEKLKDWGQAIRKVANIWADDATLKSKIEQATGLTWSQLNKLENTVQELDKATQNNNTQSWITASDNILTIWKTDPSFAKKLKEVTSLDFTDLEKIVKAGQASATAIDSQEIAKWGQAIRRVANIWVDDNTLKSTAEDLTGLSWEKLQKLDKTVQAINTAINKDTTQDWINASDAILKIWQDDPTLTQKLTTYTNLNWQDIENIVKAGQEIAKAVDQQTLAQWGNAIKSAVNIWVDNNTLTQAEKATGLTWSQLENLVLTNRLIQQAIDTNDLETWKKSTDEIINIWKEDKVLTQKLKEKAGIEWKDIEYIVKSGQAIATASQDTTLENLTAAIEQIVSIGDQDPQLKEKIRSIFELEWQKLEAISQKNQQIQADLAQQQQENWVTTNQKLINILEKNDALIQENLAPIIINPIPNQTATTNKLFTFTVAETTFTDIDKNDFLTYSATDVNGNSLPKWLSFDPKTRTFSGTSKDTTSSSVDIKLEVKDTKGLSSSNVFILTINAISNATIETFGNTKLVQDATNKLYTQIGNNNPIAIKIGATQITTNTYPGWQTLAAETVNGVNQVLWKYNDSNHLHLWSLDNNWNWQSSSGWWGLNSPEAFTQETNFQQDFNGDGIIGSPYTTIEAFGNTKLVQDATNNLYAQIGNNNPTAIKIGATQITTNTYPGWQTLAAETVNGVNQVLWKYNDSNHLHLWSLD
ncbi:MAG: VCBS repeat-containing protein, partial [Microcystis sp. M049S2]|uniref:putative Ig domain-containing protein n=1 Tax=Microcystis sp. M049S2 TaxID=2771169 RepID=UPI00258A7BF5